MSKFTAVYARSQGLPPHQARPLPTGPRTPNSPFHTSGRRNATVPKSPAFKSGTQAHPVNTRGRPPPGPDRPHREGTRLGARHGPQLRPGSPPRQALPRRPPEAAICGPEAAAAGRPPPRARPAPASRDQRTRELARGPGAIATSPGDPRRPGRADNPLPPSERRPAVTGCSLTRAMVAVAILRPSRPPRARRTLRLLPRSRAIWVPAEKLSRGRNSRD